MEKLAPTYSGAMAIRSELAEKAPELPSKLASVARFALERPLDLMRMNSKEICAELKTSEPTLIRFCRNFGFAGVSEFRIALALELAGQNQGLGLTETNLTSSKCSIGKQGIARAARELVKADRTLLLDNGSTLEIFAKELVGSGPFTVMTNGLTVADNILADPNHKVLLTGGLIERSRALLTGRSVEDALKGMTFDTFVMGADSIDANLGFSAHSEEEAFITRAMVHAAARVIVLADHTKFRRPSLHLICSFEKVATIITDQEPPKEVRISIEKKGAKFIVAAN